MKKCVECEADKEDELFEGTRKVCRKCRNKASRRSMNKRVVANGLCNSCAKRPATRSNRCEECYEQCMDDARVRKTRNKFRAIEYKGGVCQDCGFKSLIPDIYEFHHIDPTTKEFELCQKLRQNSWVNIVAELDKTSLLCCRCHRIRHYFLRIENRSNERLKDE